VKTLALPPGRAMTDHELAPERCPALKLPPAVDEYPDRVAGCRRYLNDVMPLLLL
jgi:hypothetical protein